MSGTDAAASPQTGPGLNLIEPETLGSIKQPTTKWTWLVRDYPKPSLFKSYTSESIWGFQPLMMMLPHHHRCPIIDVAGIYKSATCSASRQFVLCFYFILYFLFFIFESVFCPLWRTISLLSCNNLKQRVIYNYRQGRNIFLNVHHLSSSYWQSLFKFAKSQPESSSFIGPLVVGVISDLTESIRYAFFFLVLMRWSAVPILRCANVYAYILSQDCESKLQNQSRYPQVRHCHTCFRPLTLKREKTIVLLTPPKMLGSLGR